MEQWELILVSVVVIMTMIIVLTVFLGLKNCESCRRWDHLDGSKDPAESVN